MSAGLEAARRIVICLEQGTDIDVPIEYRIDALAVARALLAAEGSPTSERTFNVWVWADVADDLKEPGHTLVYLEKPSLPAVVELIPATLTLTPRATSERAWAALNALENLSGNILFDVIPHEKIAAITSEAAKHLRAALDGNTP